MYCRNCGKEISETDLFCPSCGTQTDKSEKFIPTAIPNFSGKLKLNKNHFYSYGSIITSGILVLLISFAKWVEIPLLSGLGSSYGAHSLLSLFTMTLKMLSAEWIPGDIKVKVCLFVLMLLAGWGLSVYFLCKYIYCALNARKFQLELLKAGLNGLIFLFIVSFVGILILNGLVSDSTYGFYDNAAALTGTTYLVLIVAVVVHILFRKK